MQATRAIVTFRQAVSYRDAAFLEGIGRQIQARVSYVSSVSETTHVYLIEPLAGRDSADAIKQLGGLPAVLRVEPDRAATRY